MALTGPDPPWDKQGMQARRGEVVGGGHSHDEICAAFASRLRGVGWRIAVEVPLGDGFADVVAESPDRDGRVWRMLVEVKSQAECWTAGGVCRQLHGYSVADAGRFDYRVLVTDLPPTPGQLVILGLCGVDHVLETSVVTDGAWAGCETHTGPEFAALLRGYPLARAPAP